MSNDPIINNSDQKDLDLQPSDVQIDVNQEELKSGYQSNNKRIAKNTLLLYLRMIVMIFVGLYTSRVILQVLGVSDYGVINAVGGMVSMLTVLTSSLTTAINRYLTFELGRGDSKQLKRIFSTSLSVLIIVSIVVLIATIA